MASDLQEPDYTFLTRRSSDDALERLGQQHQEAANKAFEMWLMHEEIVTAILHERNRRMDEKGS